MADTFTLTNRASAADLVSFCGRARRVLDGSARLIADGSTLAVYVGVLFPRGLLDKTPTVLGLRVVELAEPATWDVIVPLESLIHRIERALEQQPGSSVTVTVPQQSPSIAWAAVTPPRDGWHRRLGVSSDVLKEAASQGVSEVVRAIPESAGEAVIQKIRAEIWGQSLPTKRGIPRGAGLAADALGLLTERSLGVHTVGNWIRLSAKHGYVLVKTATPVGELEE